MLVREGGGDGQGIAGLGLRRLPLAQELGKGFELSTEVVQTLDRLDPLLVTPGLAEDVLGFLRLRPEIRRRRLLPQSRERAPRGVLIKDSPEARRGAPRRSSGR
jgi:hypothetical protein